MTNTVLTQVQNNNTNGNNKSMWRIPSSQKYKMKITNVKRCDMNTNIRTKTMQMVNEDLKFLSQIHISDADNKSWIFEFAFLLSFEGSQCRPYLCLSICTLIRAIWEIWALPFGHWAIWLNLIQDGRAMTNMGGGGPPGVGAITE